MSKQEPFKLKIENCARCGEEHDHVVFRYFYRPPEKFVAWGMCPITIEPILLEVQEVPDERSAVQVRR